MNESNVRTIIPQLFQNNIVRSRGVVAHVIIEAQLVSPNNINVYAALVSAQVDDSGAQFQ
jgi:pre-mRNA-splicing factor CWC22